MLPIECLPALAVLAPITGNLLPYFTAHDLGKLVLAILRIPTCRLPDTCFDAQLDTENLNTELWLLGKICGEQISVQSFPSMFAQFPRGSHLLAVIPYKDPSTKKESDNDVASTMATTLPMVAVREPTHAVTILAS